MRRTRVYTRGGGGEGGGGGGGGRRRLGDAVGDFQGAVGLGRRVHEMPDRQQCAS